MAHAIDFSDIEAARERIEGRVHRTPVMRSSTLDGFARGERSAATELFFKCENLQRVGAFKIRGAMNAVLALSEDEARNGVVTHSSGNHAQALALAARGRGIPCHVVMPTTAPTSKRAAVAGYGARVYECEPTVTARAAGALRVCSQTGAHFVAPFDAPLVMAGQGTCAWELLEQAPELEAIITPVGGGGLLSGCSVAARHISPGIRMFGAEPSGADDTARSKAAGKRVANVRVDTIADGLLTNVGELTWPIIDDLVEAVFTVTDEQIVAAMRLVWERMKLVIEPSAAVPVAVVLSEEFRALGLRRVGVVLSGGNVDLAELPFK
ncbi:MAG: pyridoxal-phosphate dependent enzyme [Myxococcales bacterium]|nr:pyridoxal-phosphate dependent enzyme [Myxococcales bacterium]